MSFNSFPNEIVLLILEAVAAATVPWESDGIALLLDSGSPDSALVNLLSISQVTSTFFSTYLAHKKKLLHSALKSDTGISFSQCSDLAIDELLVYKKRLDPTSDNRLGYIEHLEHAHRLHRTVLRFSRLLHDMLLNRTPASESTEHSLVALLREVPLVQMPFTAYWVAATYTLCLDGINHADMEGSAIEYRKDDWDLAKTFGGYRGVTGIFISAWVENWEVVAYPDEYPPEKKESFAELLRGFDQVVWNAGEWRWLARMFGMRNCRGIDEGEGTAMPEGEIVSLKAWECARLEAMREILEERERELSGYGEETTEQGGIEMAREHGED